MKTEKTIEQSGIRSAIRAKAEVWRQESKRAFTEGYAHDCAIKADALEELADTIADSSPWISVKDRLPEKGVRVFGWFGDGYEYKSRNRKSLERNEGERRGMNL